MNAIQQRLSAVFWNIKCGFFKRFDTELIFGTILAKVIISSYSAIILLKNHPLNPFSLKKSLPKRSIFRFNVILDLSSYW